MTWSKLAVTGWNECENLMEPDLQKDHSLHLAHKIQGKSICEEIFLQLVLMSHECFTEDAAVPCRAALVLNLEKLDSCWMALGKAIPVMAVQVSE